MKAHITVLAGDGIGPEVTREAVRALETTAAVFGHLFEFEEMSIGGASIDRHGAPLTEETVAACASAHAILLGAVGGPKWDGVEGPLRPERGLLGLRKKLDLFANLRPVKPYPVLAHACPVKESQGVDLLFVRELTAGLYFGQPRYTKEENGELHAVDTLEYTSSEIRRAAKLAFELAKRRRGKVTLVDKANVLETSRLWRKIVAEEHESHKDVTLEFMLVDAAAMRLISSPSIFDVLLTENMFGDILTDEASLLCGSLGMVPSASLGASGPGLFEPIHGSAPDIAGQGVANPIGAILSAAMLLRHSLKLEKEAGAVESAVDKTVAARVWTRDLGGTASTKDVGRHVARCLEMND